MKKFLIVLLVALTCVCLTLSACKKKAEEAVPAPTEQVAPAPEAATEAATESEDAARAAADAAAKAAAEAVPAEPAK
jgi:predicted cobalt transporter CbtA